MSTAKYNTAPVGRRYGRLVVQAFSHTRPQTRGGRPRGVTYYWVCLCDCGTVKHVPVDSLIRGNSLSCGCLLKEIQRKRLTRHGMTGSPEYYAWQQMRQRCENPAQRGYHNYGGRGIRVCERWNTFANFIFDMGTRPSADHSLERVNNDLGYSPDNCEWATHETQDNNKRMNRRLRFDGRVQTLTQWARERGMNPATLHSRIENGWSTVDALTIPVGRSIARKLHDESSLHSNVSTLQSS